MIVYCAVYDCKSTSYNEERLFYPFPKNEERCRAWIEAIERPELARYPSQRIHEEYRVCDLHFEFLDHHKILLDDAVPSIIIPQENYLKHNMPQCGILCHFLEDKLPSITLSDESYLKNNMQHDAYDKVPSTTPPEESYSKNSRLDVADDRVPSITPLEESYSKNSMLDVADDKVFSITQPVESFSKNSMPDDTNDKVPSITPPEKSYSKNSMPHYAGDKDLIEPENLIITKNKSYSKKTMPRVADGTGLILPDDLINNTPHIDYPIESSIDNLSKSTQTNFSIVSESTQTIQTCLKTSEIACQTESEDGPNHQVDNPLKRKLFITLDFEDKASKCDESIDSDWYLPSDTKVKNEVESLMCQPDISFMISNDNDTTLNVKSQKESPDKISKQQIINTKSKSKRKRIPSSESSSECELEIDCDPLMNVRLDEAIKLVQQHWKINEKNDRKGKSINKKIDDYPVDILRINQGRYCSNELKYVALNLFYSNPTAFNALRQPLNLPADKTLRRAKVGVSTKVTPTVLKCLQLKVSKLNEEEKFCIMCADMFPLKEEIHKYSESDKYIGYHEINEVQGPEPASKTLVVLIKGLYSDWIQPLTLCYLKENFNFTEVNLWLDQIIASITVIGLKVVCLTTNENPDLLGMAKKRSISIKRPYFFVNSVKVYYVFDIFHIMTSLRNLLYSMYHIRYTDVDSTEQIASWFDIEKVFATDQTRACKLAPKLTEKHIIRLIENGKNGIQLTAQIFSKTVAAGIVTCIEEKHLTEKSMGTVKFVELINNVFDILNSRDENDLFCFKDYQLEALEKMLNIASNYKVIAKNLEDKTESVETIKCLGITILSVLGIASDQKTEGFNYLSPRSLSLEHLNDLFETLRKKLGNKPTAVLFYASFRRYFLQNVIKKSESNDSLGLDKDLISILIQNCTQ